MNVMRTISNMFFCVVIVFFISIFLLEIIRFVVGYPFSWIDITIRLGFVTSILCVAIITSLRVDKRGNNFWLLIFFFMSIMLFLAYRINSNTHTAWLFVVCIYVLLLHLEQWITCRRSMFEIWGWRLLLSFIAGAIPLSMAQVEMNFADEEFFVVFEVIVLAIFWLSILASYRFSMSYLKIKPTVATQTSQRIVSICIVILVILGLLRIIYSYHRSFYPPSAPMFPGVSEEMPFICGRIPQSTEFYDGREVFNRILKLLESNPRKKPPEYGMLALATGNWHWAQRFRDSILQEAYVNRYTEPANSIKAKQYEAALRVYYYSRVQKRFPGLFSEEEERILRDWFAAINRRALTVEWVDLMYSLAFFNWPDGPFENQGSGAALLSLLETEALNDTELSSENRKYLEYNIHKQGWETLFRVTDDTFIYQLQWMYNAYFQSLYTGVRPEKNVRLSFEWILLQSLSDGSFLRYNHPGKGASSLIAYLGAKLLGDPRYVWLAGRAVEALEKNEGFTFAIPGVEEPVLLKGHSPTEGSCLMFGNSGIPSQQGPLSPDKIVFRESWDTDSSYLLVNLRFTGWHRYKATGTISLVYQRNPLAIEDLDLQPFPWLPEGRSLFRDKRIPRENLNGLAVEAVGIRQVLNRLIGFGSPWAQDPPYYADVISFETGADLDYAHIRLVNWHGWDHDRYIYFVRNQNLSIIVDTAQSLRNSQAALFWHFINGAIVAENRIRLSTGAGFTEVVFLPINSDGRIVIENRIRNGKALLDFTYYSKTDLKIATVFLSEEWIGSQVVWNAGNSSIQIVSSSKEFEIKIEAVSD